MKMRLRKVRDFVEELLKKSAILIATIYNIGTLAKPTRGIKQITRRRALFLK